MDIGDGFPIGPSEWVRTTEIRLEKHLIKILSCLKGVANMKALPLLLPTGAQGGVYYTPWTTSFTGLSHLKTPVKDDRTSLGILCGRRYRRRID